MSKKNHPIEISAVIPAFNKKNTITRAINSICAQTSPPTEIIIIDDGSTDETAQIAAAALQEAIRKGIPTKLIQKSNGGVSSARNMGYNNAKSEYIAFLDGDDEWLPEHLATLRDLISKAPGAELYFTGHKLKSPHRTIIPTTGIPENHSGFLDDYFLATAKGKTANSSNSCIPKNSLCIIGGFPEGVVAGEDLHVWITLALRGRVACDAAITSIVHHAIEHINGKRLTTVPYPLTYYKRKQDQLKKNPTLKKLLEKIGYKHYLFSICKGSIYGSYKRWRALYHINPILAMALLPPILATPITAFSSRKN